ncbi:HMG box-containing protein 4 isoform X2 [Aplysia californica]|uniref:HMG box-containing protein 4 isoform X2 n=1 Tax=Aplysia californica TaxID=6500 RepID=A0ABM0JIT5_APLCA|nr:HMG box-containing protein 4 isoform X2 [Aplysia californica]
MSKRDSDMFLDGPPAKMFRDDPDDSGGGRTGRVRKKSAKVLEMEEFEQAEKTHHTTKKGKTPKGAQPGFPSLPEEPEPVPERPSGSTKKTKTTKAAGLVPIETTPVSTKTQKVAFKLETQTSPGQPVKQNLVSLPPNSLLTAPGVTNITITSSGVKTESSSEAGVMDQASGGKEDGKSVIKYLLSSPSSGSKPAVSTNALTKLTPAGAASTPEAISTGKKGSKKKAPQEKLEKATPKPKAKAKKVKAETLSASEDLSFSESDLSGLDLPAAGLKMKIFASSDPSTALVSLASPQANTELPKQPKQKKSKKAKQETTTIDSFASDVSFGMLSGPGSDSDVDVKKPAKKNPPKKLVKKKEKLIQDAISAAKQMPNLAALVASQGPLAGQAVSSGVAVQKASQKPKKKPKAASPLLSGDSPSDSAVKSELSFEEDGEEDEVNLVIAETEKKRKKTVLKKKAPSGKGKLSPSKGEKPEKKLPKRAPTAYMLFCNTHRPTIVNENPGIEFAGISRKLGEMWQTLSSKQKISWRRKAQRRMKRGSHLISTGKVSKEAQLTSAGPLTMGGINQLNSGLKLSTILQKSPRSLSDDSPQSPTKQNFSIEPIDVAAHLKLLGESLSIIGMRLQEHKGMIAVQGSLSVLLDSLLCACGPLLCLTQQIPGMDGCSPSVHAQTLDSVAYVMPGL